MCWDQDKDWRQIIVPVNATFDELRRSIATVFGVESPGAYLFFDPTRNDIFLHSDRPMGVPAVMARRWAQGILRYRNLDNTKGRLGGGQVIERQCRHLQISCWLEALEERVHFWYF